MIVNIIYQLLYHLMITPYSYDYYAQYYKLGEVMPE